MLHKIFLSFFNIHNFDQIKIRISQAENVCWKLWLNWIQRSYTEFYLIREMNGGNCIWTWSNPHFSCGPKWVKFYANHDLTDFFLVVLRSTSSNSTQSQIQVSLKTKHICTYIKYAQRSLHLFLVQTQLWLNSKDTGFESCVLHYLRLSWVGLVCCPINSDQN